MRLTTILCAILVLSSILPSYKTCNSFWKRWQNTSCGLREFCLSGVSDGVNQSWNNNVLDCNETASDKDIFRCGNISKQITSLITKNCKYSNFDMKRFLYGRDPAVVYLDYTTNKIIPIEITFSKMKSLEMIFLKGSRTGGMFQLTFDTPNKIRTLEINNHDFNRFPPRPFVSLTGLIRMEISNGKITRLTNDLFLGLKLLKEVSLCFNQIVEIQRLAFRDFRSVTYLDLSKNLLRTIYDSTFDPMTRLEELELSYNPLRRLPQSWPFGFSNMLSTITLAYCKLRELPKIDWNSHNLISVDLTGNNITNAVLPVYAKNRTNVNLNNNNIKTIKLNLTRIFDVSPVYSLFYNEPVCDCRLESFLEFLHSSYQKSYILFPGMDVVMCAAPNSTRTLASVWPNYISCVKGCPPLCSCIFLTKNTIEVNCSSRGLKMAPTILPSITVTIYLQNNNINDLSNLDSSSWHAVTKLYVSNNKMKTLQGWKIPSSLTTLALDKNDLTDLPMALMEVVDRTDRFRIYLATNNWSCDCKSASLITWIQKNKEKIIDYETITCTRNDTGKWTTQYINGSKPEEFCPLFSPTPYFENVTVTTSVDIVLISSMLSLFGLLLLILLSCLLLYCRSLLARLYDRMSPAPKVSETQMFDVFVCYTDADRKAAIEISNKLEPQYQVYLFDKSMLSSQEASKRISFAMRKSKAILLLISGSFLSSDWFQTEFRRMYRKLPDKIKSKTIPVFFEDIESVKFLPRSFRHLWYSKCRLRWEENFFYEKLIHYLKN